MIPVTSTGHTSVDIGVNANLELVGKFFYFPFCDDVIFHIIISSLLWSFVGAFLQHCFWFVL